MKSFKKQDFWIDHIKKQQASTLTLVEYCRQNNLKKGTFSAIKSKIKNACLSSEKSSQLMIPLLKSSNRPFEIQLNGFKISFVDVPSPEWMAKLIKNLEAIYA